MSTLVYVTCYCGDSLETEEVKCPDISIDKKKSRKNKSFPAVVDAVDT